MRKNDTTTLGESISSIRKGMGLSAKAFAEAMQIDEQTQRSYEAGKTSPMN